MNNLRDPNNGCPWDIKQTYKTIIPHTLEEAYEVADAIERGDIEELKLELGDLLFQVIFYAQLGDEENHFNFDDIISALVDKLLRRHPHVFPEGTLASFGRSSNSIDEEQIKKNWEKIKLEERREKTQSLGVLDNIPSALPALTRAEKLQKRASQVGFDWEHIDDVFDKLYEELDELKAAIKTSKQEDIFEELGDVLFSCVNLARHLNVGAESALRNTNTKFIRRFKYIEETLSKNNETLEEAEPQKMEEIWIKAKSKGL